MRYLRANTATRVTVGPFVDGLDGVTPETALTVTSLKLTMVVDDAGVPTVAINANATASAGDNDLVHIAADTAGLYDLELTANNCNYIGARTMLTITPAVANTCCPVFHEFTILPTQVYDSLLNANDLLQVHANEITAGLIANTTFAANAITAAVINDGAIDAATFATNAITATVVADSTLTSAKLATNCITSTQLATNCIAAAQIADNAIDAASIATGAITNAKFAANALDAAALAPDAGTEIAVAVWANATKAVTLVGAGGINAASFAANALNAAAIDPDAGTEIAVAVWANATRSITDKTGFTAAPTAGSIANTSFAANAITAAVIADAAIDAGTFAANAIAAAGIADGAIDAATFAANAINAAAIADGAIDAATFATNAITATVIADGAIDVATFAANAINAAVLDPDVRTEIWGKAGAITTLAMDVLVERLYHILNNRMTANESDGNIALRNAANDANLATGNVVSSSGTTARAALSWV